jgi:hypothetical protein
VVGPDPPADRSVHAAVASVATDVPTVRRSAEQRVEDGRTATRSASGERERLARRVAGAVVIGLLPPAETRFALRGDYPVTALTRHRYHRLASLLGVDLRGSLAEDPAETNVTRATRLLTAGLADRLSASFHRSSGSPETIESEIAVGRVRITVRTWGAS